MRASQFSRSVSSRSKLASGFTLIELGVTIAVTAIFLAFSFSNLSFRHDFWALREESFSFTKELQHFRELSFQGLTLTNQRICAVGLLVKSLTPPTGAAMKQTLGVAVATTTRDCLLIHQADFDLTSKVKPETDPTVIKLTPLFDFTVGAGPFLTKTFATTTLTLEVDGTPLSFTTFELSFRDPYGEPVVFADGRALDDLIAPRRWSLLTFRLQLKNEQAAVSVTRTGQLLLR